MRLSEEIQQGRDEQLGYMAALGIPVTKPAQQQQVRKRTAPPTEKAHQQQTSKPMEAATTPDTARPTKKHV